MSKTYTAFDIEDLLREIQKPGRYTGGEYNSVKKDPAGVDVKVALVFPDVYEVGMSYIGQKILYYLINSRSDCLAERVFTPWIDLEQKLRIKDIPLFSLENRLPLFQFDLIGFSLLYELNYTNVLTVLDLGKIPFLSAEREDRHPLIIGGGPSAFNPEPIAEIFDLFLIGDGEEAIFEILENYIQLKKNMVKRDEILKRLSRIKGIYVPSLYETYQPSNSSLLAVRSKKNGNLPIRKRIYFHLKQGSFPDKFVVPNTKIIFDRVAVEIERGCPQKCRFCQASQIYFPPRIKEPASVVKEVVQNVDSTGYEDVSLSALSVSDHPYLSEMIEFLMAALSERKISLSLPSLRPGGLTPEIMENILKVRKTGITLVPEAGTERLRRVINKSLTEEEIKEAAVKAFSYGWLLLKLYFMIGLPTETQDDLLGIVGLVKDISLLGKDQIKRTPQINLSISSFIPKPHTPFQWVAMDSEKSLKEKQNFLRSHLRTIRSIKFKNHPVQNSLLEGIFSRGDRRLSSVLIHAWKHGARFDGWNDRFDFRIWEEAFKTVGVDQLKYLDKIPLDTVLPWDHISTGVKKEFLLRELHKALQGERSDICEKMECRECRGCMYVSWYEKKIDPSLPSSHISLDSAAHTFTEPHRYRLYYTKQGPARFLSQIDVNNIIQRTLRRADIHVAFSQGFHPKLLMSTLPALPLGMEGRSEIIEFFSYTDLSDPNHLIRLNSLLPEGFHFICLEKKPKNAPTLTDEIKSIVYSFELKDKLVKRSVEQKIREYWKCCGEIKLSVVDVFKAYLKKNKISFNQVTFEKNIDKIYFELPFSSKKMIRSQDIVSELFGIPNAVYFMAREEVRFDKGEDRSEDRS